MIRSIAKLFIPKKIIEWRRAALLQNQFRYAQDGLYTMHHSNFIQDPDFARAYSAGKATGSWGNYEIVWRVHTVLWAAKRAMQLPGDFVECGVNRGGLSRAIIGYVNFDKSDKKFYLLDTFEGYDASVLTEEEKGRIDKFGNYQSTYEEVKKTFAPFPNVNIIKGSVPGTLSQVNSEKVAFLSIDMNCVQPEIAALEFFWPKLVSGGIIVMDDFCYADFGEQNRAHTQWAAGKGVTILTMPTGQGIIIKP